MVVKRVNEPDANGGEWASHRTMQIDARADEALERAAFTLSRGVSPNKTCSDGQSWMRSSATVPELQRGVEEQVVGLRLGDWCHTVRPGGGQASLAGAPRRAAFSRTELARRPRVAGRGLHAIRGHARSVSRRQRHARVTESSAKKMGQRPAQRGARGGAPREVSPGVARSRLSRARRPTRPA